MSIFVRILYAVFFLSGVVACNGDGTGIGNDVEPRIIAGGGTGDGPIDGRLNVIVLDDETEDPIQSAFVLLSSGSGPDLTGTTDADGVVTFRGTSIKGPQNVTVYKEDYTLMTIFALNAANLTATLDLVDPGPDPAQDTATVKGQVTGFENIAEPPQGSYKIAMVGYSIPDLFSEDFEWIEQEGDPPTNLVIPDAPNQDDLYELKTWVGRQSTTAIGGIFTPVPNEDPEFTFSHMGIVRNLVTVKDQVKENVDVDLSIPLDQPSEVTVSGKPSGTNEVNVFALLDLADDGQVVMQILPGQTADTWSGNLPALSGDLADGVFHLAARAYNRVCVGQDCQEELPASMIIRRDLAAADLTTATVNDFLAPPGSMSVDTGTLSFSFSVSADADLSFADLQDPDEKKLWSIVLFEPGADTFQLPTLPDEAGFAGLSGTLTWTHNVTSMEAGVDPNDFQFDDLGQAITHMSSDESEFTK